MIPGSICVRRVDAHGTIHKFLNNCTLAVPHVVNKGLFNVFTAAYSMKVSLIDLEKLAVARSMGKTPPFTLQSLYEDAIDSTWRKALDQVGKAGKAYQVEPELSREEAGVIDA